MARIVPATRQWIEEAARIIRGGGLVVFPTETVYGLGANALDSAAVQAIFAAKGRPATNPVIVHIASVSQLPSVCAESNSFANRIAEAFWPGPIAVILPKHGNIPAVVTAGGPTVAVRIPAHPAALALLRESGVPIAAPSANRSEAISPTLAEHVAESLGGAVDLILDGGPCAVGLESTVLNLCADPPTILRPGAITADQIEAVLGVRPIGAQVHASTDAPMASPGQMRRHYAPKTPLIVRRNALAEALRHPGAVVVTHKPETHGLTVRVLPNNPREYAARLYATLRELDSSGASLILVETVPEGDDWAAVRDRLSRAAEPEARGMV